MQSLTNAPKISMIVAVAQNDVIGAGGAMPWQLSSDLKRFRELTLGKPVIMGRKTYLSLDKPLSKRPNIVVSKISKLAYQGVWVVEDIEEALVFGKNLCEECGADEIMVIGGGLIYKAALPLVERIYLTRVHASPDGDVFFPQLDMDVWSETAVGTLPAGPKDDFECSLLQLDRVAPDKPATAGPERPKFRRPGK